MNLKVRFATWLLKGSHWYCKKFNFFFPNHIKCKDIYEDECFPCAQYTAPLDGQDK